MDYREELNNILRPLGIYDLESVAVGAETGAVGSVLNSVYQALESAETEALPLTAADIGLSNWEALLPFRPAFLTAADRRRAIAALLRIDGASFTVSAINDTAAGCGLRAAVEETDEPMTVQVSFPYNRGMPDGLDELKRRIELILPCHLAVSYVFVYPSWAELESLFSVWAEIEEEDLAWQELERVGGEEA